MLNWIRRQMKQEEGLTLIELIVVVAIIAVLAFTITPRVLTALDNSRLNGARSVANELHSSLERFYVNKDVAGTATYPLVVTHTFSDLRAVLSSDVGLTSSTDNVFAQTGSPAVPVFGWYAYSDAAGTTLITGTSTAALNYCIRFTAKNSPATHFRVTPQGVDEAATAFTCTGE